MALCFRHKCTGICTRKYEKLHCTRIYLYILSSSVALCVNNTRINNRMHGQSLVQFCHVFQYLIAPFGGLCWWNLFILVDIFPAAGRAAPSCRPICYCWPIFPPFFFFGPCPVWTLNKYAGCAQKIATQHHVYCWQIPGKTERGAWEQYGNIGWTQPTPPPPYIF